MRNDIEEEEGEDGGLEGWRMDAESTRIDST